MAGKLAYIVVVVFRFLRKYFVYLLHKCIPILAKGNPMKMLRYVSYCFSIYYQKCLSGRKCATACVCINVKNSDGRYGIIYKNYWH